MLKTVHYFSIMKYLHDFKNYILLCVRETKIKLSKPKLLKILKVDFIKRHIYISNFLIVYKNGPKVIMTSKL